MKIDELLSTSTIEESWPDALTTEEVLIIQRLAGIAARAVLQEVLTRLEHWRAGQNDPGRQAYNNGLAIAAHGIIALAEEIE